MEIVKEDERGKIFQADDFKIVYRNKGTTSGDNSENVEELIYLIAGSAEITLKDSIRVVRAPLKIEFPAKTYHKIKALTDITFILFEK